ncbi:hypothetical protein E4T39_00885 [Aureobasidium subglaciale]|nr:hypothetical protein E4T39_00885 [Aureobasidium subglaciale]
MVMSTHTLVSEAGAWSPNASYHAPSSYHYEALIAIAAAFLALTVTFTSLRFFVRGYMIRALGWDDWLILLALNSFICQAAFLIHIAWVEKTHNLELIKPLSSALEVLEKWQRRTIIISTVIFSLYTFGFFFVAIFQCGDPSKYLVHKVQGKCMSWSALGPLNYIHGVMNALTDWVFVSLPILVVRKANMRGRDKWSVVFVLIIGILGSVASVVRLFYIHDLHSGDKDATTFFSNASTIAIASTFEPGMGITAACMATLRPLFKSVLDRTRTHISSSSGKNKLSTAERGLPSRGGVTSPPQSPCRGEFAQYGFASEGKSRSKSEPQVEMYDMSGRTSAVGSDEVMVQFDTVQSERRESQSQLLAELQQARQAYSARIWSGDDNAEFGVLRAATSGLVAQRGILIAHPREEFELLEEGVLEALDLLPERIGYDGQYRPRTPGIVLDDEEAEEDREAKPCETCQRVHASEAAWYTRVYAANGLMRAGAWAACWSEMERVDVEVRPCISEELCQRLDDMQSAEQAVHEHGKHDQNHQTIHEIQNAELSEQWIQLPAPLPTQCSTTSAAGYRNQDKRSDDPFHTLQNDLPPVYQPKDVPLCLVLRNYIYLVLQDRRNVIVLHHLAKVTTG